MGYTWEDVMLGIDVKAESTSKQEREAEIREKQLEEASAMSLWSLGLSLIGGALFGPAGFTAGKQLGRHGADWYYDWESMEVDVGKFNKEDAIQFNKDIKKAAKDQDAGHIISSLTDLATMYVQSGGLTAQPGEWDPTTFGSGEGEWTVFGRKGSPFTGTTWASDGAGGMIHPVTGEAIGSAPMPTGIGGVPSLWSKDVGLTKNLLNVGGNLGTAYTQGQSVDYLYDQWRQYQKENDEG